MALPGRQCCPVSTQKDVRMKRMLMVAIHRGIPKSIEAVQAPGMRAVIVVKVTRADRHRLEAIVSDRSAPQKHVWRADVVLPRRRRRQHRQDHAPFGQIQKPVVWRWQARFMAEGVEGLTRNAAPQTRRPLPTGTVQRVVDLALGPPPGETTHWTGRWRKPRE